MKSLIVEKDGSVALREVPLPGFGGHEMLVKVQASAVCGTDMKILHNSLKGFTDYPTMLGHEAAGVVVGIGNKVRNYKVGDSVIMPMIFSKCGEYFSTWGAMSEYAVAGDAAALIEDGIPLDDVHAPSAFVAQNKIPGELDPVSATMIITFREVYSTMKRLKFAKGQNIVIYGAGPVGMTFIKFAKLMGLSPVVCVDITDDKIAQAKSVGADIGINSAKVNAGEEIRKLFPKGADILLDAAGVPALINENVKLVREFGSVCVYGVTPKNELMMSWQEAPYAFDLRFVQWPSKTEEASVHDEIVNMMLEGKLDGRDFISDVYDFDKAVEAIDFFTSRRNNKKIVLKMQG
jgi:threonine dehydrogenase-like Zn-dependent dehydrogenase